MSRNVRDAQKNTEGGSMATDKDAELRDPILWFENEFLTCRSIKNKSKLQRKLFGELFSIDDF